MAAKHFLAKLAAEVGSGRSGVTSADAQKLAKSEP
jgi:hypothetical protein